MKKHPKQQTMDWKKIDTKLENLLRWLVKYGYEMGKKQIKTPYNYTLDTDIVKKEWLFIKSLLSLKEQEVCRKMGAEWIIKLHQREQEVKKEIIKEIERLEKEDWQGCNLAIKALQDLKQFLSN